MSTMIGTRIADTIFEDLEYVAQEENADKSKVMRELLAQALKEKLIDLALYKYAKRTVSVGKAAELAKIPLADFMRLAAERKIPFNYSLESLQRDLKAAR